MLRPGISECDVNSFFGSLGRLAQSAYQIPLTNSILAVNLQYLHGQVGSRYGTSVPTDADGNLFLETDGQVTAFLSWLFSFSGALNNCIVYYAPAVGVKGWQQSGAGFTATLMPVTGAAGASMAVSGERLYAAFYDSTGRLGTNIGYVYGWDIGADQLFAPPITNAITATDVTPGSGPGLITAGAHNIGYLYTTRNGYTGPICPATPSSPVANFTPLVHTAAGGQALQLTISGSLPSYLVGGTTNVFQIVMTTVANPGQYFAVPGAIGLCSNPTNITINISDAILAQTGTDVTAYMNLLTAQASGTGPVSPVSLGTYSARMGYCGIDLDGLPVVYFSEPNNYQYITADQHGIYLDGFQQPVVHYTINGVDYIATVNSHFSVEDNGDVPVTWIPPQKIDGSIGVPSPTCVAVNPSLGYALIASERGFYIFQGGVFPALPVSYYQSPDWNRINWISPTSVQVVDDPLNKKWSVLAPLTDIVVSVTGTGPYTITTQNHCSLYQSGLSVTFTGVETPQTIMIVGYNQFTVPSQAPAVGATIFPQSATHVLTWDYTEGDTPETVKYSLNSNVGYLTGATAQVLNAQTNLTEVWYAPFTAATTKTITGTSNTNPDIITVPSHGYAAGQVLFISGAMGDTAINTEAVVTNPTTNTFTLTGLTGAPISGNGTYRGGGAATTAYAFLRRCDGTEKYPNRDIATNGITPVAISSWNQGPLVPGAQDNTQVAVPSTKHNFYGVHMRVLGQGGLNMEYYGLDSVITGTPAASPLTLSPTPGEEILVRWFMRSPQQSFGCGTNTLDSWWVLALCRFYYGEAMPQGAN